MKINYITKIVQLGAFIFIILLAISCDTNKKQEKELLDNSIEIFEGEEKSLEQKRQFAIERAQYEFDFQKDPATGTVSREQKQEELQAALEMRGVVSNSRTSANVFTSRGPSNLGGRTRAVVVDISDPSGNTLIAGGVSSGVFRSIDDGASWTKVSALDEIHNVTAIVQDPRPGFQNIWYYGTGETFGNSASLGSTFHGQGVWRSEDGGLTWEIIPGTSTAFESFDSTFDFINALAVSPITGDLFIAAGFTIERYDGTSLTTVLDTNFNSSIISFALWTDVTIDTAGRVYAALDGRLTPGTGSDVNGVHLSLNNGNTFTRIAENGNPSIWNSAGRIVLASAPSNDDFLYAIYDNGDSSAANQVESDLWRYNRSTNTWTNFTSRMPDLPGGPIGGIDPFAIQDGYDLDVSVSFNDHNRLAIAGTSAYLIQNIETDPEFEHIGGYNGAVIALYETPGGDIHHPDVHDLTWDPFDDSVFYTGTDGGVHRTNNVDATNPATNTRVDWVNLNNNYQTYQYYDVALEPLVGSDFVLGGAQDNGTTGGGVVVGLPDSTTMVTIAGGDGVSVAIADRPTPTTVQFYFGFQLGPIFRFPGTDIRPLGTGNGLFVTLFHLDNDNTNTLYYASGSSLFRTNNAPIVTTEVGDDAGAWTNLGTVSGGQTLRSFATTRGAYNPDTSYLLIGGQNGGVFRLDDPQNANGLGSAVNITPPGNDITGAIVSAMSIHPTNPDIAMVVYANFGIPSIFITNNATSNNPTWTQVERNLAPFSIRSAAVVDVDGQTGYYVGTARGLYSNLSPTSTDWKIEGQGQLGLALISDLEYRPTDNTLLIGTHGNGMFETTLQALESNACPTTTTFTAAKGWDNGVPNVNVAAFVNDDYDTAIMGDIEACRLTIGSRATLRVADNDFVSVENDIIVIGELVVENAGSVVQVENEAVTTNLGGSIEINKTTPVLQPRDFIVLSSPMSDETSSDVFPSADRVFLIDPTEFEPDASTIGSETGVTFLDVDGNYFSPATALNVGEGYLVFPQAITESTPVILDHTYTNGTLNSGVITKPLVYNGPATINNFNLLGNPYPSAIDVDQLIGQNQTIDEVYFWEHITKPDESLPGFNNRNFSMDDVSIRNMLGGIASANGGTAPGQFMASGQGFGILANQSFDGTPFTFTNGMRVTGNNGTIRSSKNPIERLWLRLDSEKFTLQSIALIGFADGASKEFDNGFDSQRLATTIGLFSTLDSGEQLTIQGRETFDSTIKIALGFTTQIPENETYTIGIDSFEGTNLEKENIFLVDNVLGVITDLKKGVYSFTATEGTQVGRFTLSFNDNSILGVEDEISFDSAISIFPNPASEQITLAYLGNQQLSKAQIIDVNGKIISEIDLLNFNQSRSIDISNFTSGVYFIQIQGTENAVVKRLIIE